MRIGIDVRTLMDKHYSGVSEYTLNLVREILKIDKENKYFLFYNSFKNIDKRIPKFSGKNVEIVRTAYPNKLFNNIFQKIFKIPKLDQLLKVDLFFAPNIGFSAISRNCKKILTVHDLSFIRFPEFFSFKRRLWHKIINIKKIIINYSLIVAVSANTKNDIVELAKVDPDKIVVIYPGISKEYRRISDQPTLDNVKYKYNLPTKFILYLGTIEPRKNINSLITAFDKMLNQNPNLGDYNLVIAGMRGWKERDIFRAQQQSRFPEKIKFIGYVEARDKPALYNLAKVFVYPSFYEGFGFPPLEAMACACPTIVSQDSSLVEITGDGAWPINPNDINSLARGLETIINNKKIRLQLIDKGVKQAVKFNWQQSAKKYIEIFNNYKKNN